MEWPRPRPGAGLSLPFGLRGEQPQNTAVHAGLSPTVASVATVAGVDIRRLNLHTAWSCIPPPLPRSLICSPPLGFWMPKHVCGARLTFRGFWVLGRRCKAPAVKTKRGTWRCRLHGGLSCGPTSPEGKARIAAAARARWADYREGRKLTADSISNLRTGR
jgi:hypothetical protein